MEVSTVGFLEEKNAELEKKVERMKKILKDATVDLHISRHCMTCIYDLNDPSQCTDCTTGRNYQWRHYEEVSRMIGGGEDD